MLTLTRNAAEVVRELTASSPFDDDGGLRIAAGEPTPEGTPLTLSFVDGPESDDEAVHAEGAHVFLEQPVAQLLDDKVLDAHVIEDGVRFDISEQGEPGPSPDGAGPAL